LVTEYVICANQVKVKTKKAVPAVKTPAKESSDSSSEESDDESEQFNSLTISL
jgi:hypothetical protein